ncbi:MAG: 50S ribosomal protein L32 [Chloroflexota bacterium]
MAPLPKKKCPKARRRERRAHLGLTEPKLVPCSQCGSLKLPHHACPACGTYHGREAIEVKNLKKAA